MTFWDSSAILPLCVREPESTRLRSVYRGSGAIVVWWSALIECHSALERRKAEGDLTANQKDQAADLLAQLAAAWHEVQPTPAVRSRAIRLLAVHSLRAADAMHLAAALTWCGENPAGRQFVCLDHRMGQAAAAEGFEVIPARPA